MYPHARRLLDSAILVADSPLSAVATDITHLLASNETSSRAPPYYAGSDPYMTSHFTPSMAIIVVVLLSAFFFMAVFSIYVRRCTTDDDFNPSTSRRLRLTPGLDRTMVESLPIVNYSADAVKEDNDSSGCVVCLTDFEDGEPLRLLPKCQHCFHPQCIDLWLNSNSTCPMCRRSLLTDKDASSQRGVPNREVAMINEGNSTGDAPVSTDISSEVGDGVDALTPAVAVNMSDAGTEQGETTRERNQMGDHLLIGESCAAGRPDNTGEASSRLHDSPIHGVVSSSPSHLQSREAFPQSRLRRANSTGHSLVRRAFNRANCLLPAESNDLGRPLSSCVPITATAMHRSRSHTALPLSLVDREEDADRESELSAMRGVDISKGWNFSFKRGLSLGRSPEQALVTTVGESSSTSVRRTFDRLPV